MSETKQRSNYSSTANEAIDGLEHRLAVATETMDELRSQLRSAEVTAGAPLIDAINTMSEAFALFDAEDRLQLFNRRYVEEIWPQIADIIVVGVAFETIVREGIKRGGWGCEDENVESIFDSVMQRHCDLPSTHEIWYRNGRCVRQVKQRTGTGGVVAVYADITEIKRREAALLESESRLRSIIENAPFSFSLKNLKGEYTEVNRRFLESVGVSRSELANWPNEKLFQPEFADLMDQMDKEVLGKSRSVHKLVKFGEEFELPGIREVTKFPIIDETNDIVGIGAISIDVTAREQAVTALRESESRLRSIIDNAPFSLSLKNRKGEYIEVNKVFLESVGAQKSEILGKNARSIYPPEFADQMDQMDRQILSEERAVQRIVQLGAEFSASGAREVTKFPIIDEANKVTGIGDISIDRTAREHADEQLRNSEAKLRAVDIAAPVGILEFDKDGKCVHANKRWCDTAGMTEEEALGDGWIDKVHPDDRDSLFSERRAEASHDRPFSLTHRLLRPGQKEIWVLGRAAPMFDDSGIKSGYVCTITDITDRKQIEDEVQKLNFELEQRVTARTTELHSAQAELVNKARLATLGQLAATVSHELRNPLGTIAMSLAVLDAKTRDQGIAAEPSLDRMLRAISRADRIIDEMLDYARSRELNCLQTEFDNWLCDVLNELPLPDGVLSDHRFQAAGAMIDLDRERFRRVIVNLYDNACQAMTEGDQPNRAEQRVVVETHSNGDWLTVSVADQGPGMSADVLDNAFEPLYSTKAFGIGLGLPIVKQITEDHGGEIEILSAEGTGTRVIVKLPISQIDIGFRAVT